MNIANLIFDFDGTLADTSEVILATIRETVKELKLPARGEREYRATIGYRLDDVPSILWPGESNPADVYVNTYRAIFNRIKNRYRASLFPGVAATLSRLHEAGYGMAVASSRSHASLADYLEETGIVRYFSCIVGGDDVARGKPSPEPVEAILKSRNWEHRSTLVTGDMAVDIAMGVNAGTPTCGVTYGNGSREELIEAGAEFIIDRFDELPEILGVKADFRQL